jgi:hypothetical protein
VGGVCTSFCSVEALTTGREMSFNSFSDIGRSRTTTCSPPIARIQKEGGRQRHRTMRGADGLREEGSWSQLMRGGSCADSFTGGSLPAGIDGGYGQCGGPRKPLAQPCRAALVGLVHARHGCALTWSLGTWRLGGQKSVRGVVELRWWGAGGRSVA